MSSVRVGLLSALIAVISWGGQFSIMAHLLHVWDPFWLTSIRYIIASTVLAVLLLVLEGPAAFRVGTRGWLLLGIGTAGIAGFNLFILPGIRLSSAEHGALFVALAPAMITLILWARTRQAPPRVTLAMLALAFIGVFLVVTKGRLASLADGSAYGDALCAVAVASFAVYTAFTPAFGDWSRLRFAALSIGAGTIATLALSGLAIALGIVRAPGAIDASDVTGMLYLSLIAAVLAFLAWANAIRALGAQNAGLFMNAVPVVAFIIGIVQGTRFSPVEYAGAAITIAALAGNNLLTRATAPGRSAE